MLRLDGKVVSQFIEQQLIRDVQVFKEKQGISPGLAVILVGEDSASQVYVKNKEKACARLGFRSFMYRWSETITETQLFDEINQLNQNPEIHGILVQLPLPRHIRSHEVLKRINPMKDADGFAYENMGLLWSGQARVAPCTPQGIMHLLDYYKIPLEGKKAVVVGRSNIVGKPMAQLLLDRNATVTICHSKTQDLSAVTREADVVVVAVGKPRILGKEDFKQGSVIVDVGMHRLENGKLCGDVRFEELEDWVAAATPVPGGVGLMTVSTLLKNTLDLANLNLEKKT